MFHERLLIDWRTLKAMGWPYSRSHTKRLIEANRFAKPVKLLGGNRKREKLVWYAVDVLPFLEKPTQ